MSCRISAHTGERERAVIGCGNDRVRAAELGEELPGAKGVALALR